MKINKINWKKVLRVFLWIQGLLLLGLMLGYVNHIEQLQRISDVSIEIDNQPSGVYFIDKQDVITMLNDRALYPLGKRVEDVDTRKIESLLDDYPYVYNAEVYVDVKGRFFIDVKQRKAMLRVINYKGEHFYMDSAGALMPVSDQYIARVPVASGNIIGSPLFTEVSPILADEDSVVRSRHQLMDSLYMIADYITKDAVLTALVQQIYVTPEHEFELIPNVGRQKILFGTVEDMEDKFNRLIVFYQKGIIRRGWDAYETINLKYKDQVICTKPESEEKINTNTSTN